MGTFLLQAYLVPVCLAFLELLITPAFYFCQKQGCFFMGKKPCPPVVLGRYPYLSHGIDPI